MPYDVNPKFYVCTNKNCARGVASLAHTGKASSKKCYICGKPLRECSSEPRR